MFEDRQPNSPYGVVCAICGKQGLAPSEYVAQMMRPDSLWKCPVCNGFAEWDDDRFEAALDPEPPHNEWHKEVSGNWHLVSPTGRSLILVTSDEMKELIQDAIEICEDNRDWAIAFDKEASKP